MNNDRRKRIREAMETLGQIRPLAESLQSALEEIRDEERESADTIAENFPDGERAEKAEQSADALDTAADSAAEIVAALDEIESNTDTATE